MNPELIARINELARKAKSEGLTDAEFNERDTLRKKYLAEFRESFKKNYLDKIHIVDENGNEIKLTDKKVPKA